MSEFNGSGNSDETRTRPSKSLLKREKQALQELGKRIIDLPKGHFVRIPLSESMKEAMMLYKRLNSHEARRRQLQFIGKNMHAEDLHAINAVFEQIENESRYFRQHFRKLEQMRDDLVENGDIALEMILDEYPHLNRQEIRQLMRRASNDKSKGKKSNAGKKLFDYLQVHIEMDL